MDGMELARVAERRLHPRLSDPNYLVLRSRRIIFERWLSQINNGATLLDVGGRYQPYRPLLGNRVGKYVAIDLRQTPLVDVIADGQRLPFASGTFDLAIATQVLEYIPDPRQAANEGSQSPEARRSVLPERCRPCSSLWGRRVLELYPDRFALHSVRVREN